MTKPNEDMRPLGYGISIKRFRTGEIWGYEASIVRNGGRIRRGFSVKECGGVAGALVSARRYRDEIIRAHPPITKLQFCVKLRSTNTSGVSGVRRVQRSKEHVVWAARTELAGRYLSKTFRVDVYGEEGAKQLAIEERQRQLAQVENAYRLISFEARELYARQCDPPENIPIPIVNNLAMGS